MTTPKCFHVVAHKTQVVNAGKVIWYVLEFNTNDYIAYTHLIYLAIKVCIY